MKTCRVCEKPEKRRHRHDDPDHAMKVRAGRMVAKEQRRWIRSLVVQARAVLDRTTTM